MVEIHFFVSLFLALSVRVVEKPGGRKKKNKETSDYLFVNNYLRVNGLNPGVSVVRIA